MKIGALDVEPVIDGIGVFPATMAFTGTSDADWAGYEDLLHPGHRVELAYGGFLVRGSGDRVILVDAGVGDTIKWGEHLFEAGHLLPNLRRFGVAPEDVTDVVLTHLHYDHVGWTTRKGEIVFPNATYRCHERDWAHFVTADPSAGSARKLSPLAERLELWGADGPLFAGIDTLAAPGHTPGSTVVVLSSGGARALLLGDVVHCPVQLIDPEWSAIADVDPALALRTREALAREIESTDVQVAASHFPGLQFGRLLRTTRERTWQGDWTPPGF